MNKEKQFIFGNEAVAQGALEAGIGLATTFPGTPASEIGDYLYHYSKENKDFYFEYSTNEKIALETAAGAGMSGLKSLVSFKHYGLNVAQDALLPLVYLEAPFVLAVADDPGSWSSIQAEQDSRWISRLAKLPTFEPADPAEAKTMTKLAFKLSEKYKIPVMVRLTTRVSLSREPVEELKIPLDVKYQGKFEKPSGGFKLSSQQTVKLHRQLLEKIEKIKKELANDDQLNRIENKDAKSKLGLITTGVAYHYAKEALKNLDLDIPILKIGLSFPFDQEKIISFAKNLNQVLVVEEIDGVVEEEVKKVLAKDIKIFGKDKLPQEGELRPETVTKVLAEIAGKKELIVSNFDDKEVPTRIPFFCPGCPHRGSFYAIKKALGDKKIYGGDIGCYMLGAYQPNNLMDFIVSMGSSISLSHGISKATGEKPIALIGDGTFFHAGLPALVNLVYNHDDILLIVLDNRFTAMTGQQPNPGTGSTELQGVGKVKIEEIAKSVGADNVAVANAFNPKKTTETVKELYGQKGVSVLVIKGDCRMAPEQKKIVSQKPKYQFKKSARLDKQERENLESIGCPAISLDKDRENIDQDICVGCSLCVQIDPDDIEVNNRKGKDE